MWPGATTPKAANATFFVNGVAGAAPEGAPRRVLRPMTSCKSGRAAAAMPMAARWMNWSSTASPWTTRPSMTSPIRWTWASAASNSACVPTISATWASTRARGVRSPWTRRAALFTTWQTTLPSLGLGAYKIDLRVTDSVGNRQYVEGAWDVAVIAPDLAVSKESDVTLAGLGDSVGFTIRYTNTGARGRHRRGDHRDRAGRHQFRCRAK